MISDKELIEELYERMWELEKKNIELEDKLKMKEEKENEKNK